MSGLKVGIITFPGSNCDRDMQYVFQEFYNARADILWHRNAIEETYDLLALPGGFSYGDYLRSGAIAQFAPAMNSLKIHSYQGRPVIGICNGFQILCEAGLLPGALIRNVNLKHIARPVDLRAYSNVPFTDGLDFEKIYRIPVSHSDGNYRIDDDGLKKLQDQNRIAFRYTENPNGSMDDIAGIVNEKGNILGMMPHPERATDPVNGDVDGRLILDAIVSRIT